MKKIRLVKGFTLIAALMAVAFVFGCSSSSSTPEEETSIIKGTIVDGKVKGAKIKYKGAVAATSDSNGNFSFTTTDFDDDEVIETEGGIDVATGAQIKISLKTKVKKNAKIVVSPISTLAVALGEAKVKTLLGITDDDDIDLYNFNPVEVAQSGSDLAGKAVEIQKFTAKIMNTITIISESITLGTQGASEADIYASVLDGVVESIDEGTLTDDNLSDSTAVEALFVKSVTKVKTKTAVDDAAVDNVKISISAKAAEMNQNTKNIVVTGGNVVGALTSIAATQRATNTTVVTAVKSGNTTIITNTNVAIAIVVSETQIDTGGFVIVEPTDPGQTTGVIST